MIESIEEANSQKEKRRFYWVIRELRTGFQPRTSMCKGSDNKLIGNEDGIKERWKQ